MKAEYPAPEAERQLKALWQLAFGDSEAFVDLFFATGYSPDRCRCLSIEGQMAAALYWLDCECAGQKLAYIYAVATHPDFRGRGLCRRLMEDAHRILADREYAGAVLYPAEEGLRKMYGKMGYADWSTMAEFSCTAGDPVPVRRLDADEYAVLRRRFLPRGGVLQEGESLAYLQACACLYAGEDFLLAAAAEGERLKGMELLGSRDAAPGILAALGYAAGDFRTPGADIPFAMFRPIKTSVKKTGYFGLVFD